MSLVVSPEIGALESIEPLVSREPIIEVEGVTKIFERWRSPLFWGVFKLLRWLSRHAPGPIAAGLAGVKARFSQDFCALRDVSFSLSRGESLGIIGQNGSGKTTLLQIIAGTLRPTAGKVIVRGRVAALLGLGCGFDTEFTGRENVLLNAALLGMSEEEVRERYDAIVRFADIGDFISQPIKTYSSGMLVRLAFSVAVHANADILIVDEALAVGDVFFQQKCYRKIQELMNRGVTLLFVSHDSNIVQSVCETGVILQHGRKIFEGPAEQCAHRYMRSLYAPETEPAATRAASPLPPPELDLREPDRLAGENVVSPEIRAEIIGADVLPTARARHGEKRLEFLAVSFTDSLSRPANRIAMGDAAHLAMLVRVNQGVNNPELVFRLIDRLGNLVFCSCNSSLGYQLGEFSTGSVFAVRFEVVLAVATGPYTLTVEIGKHAENRPNIGIYFDIAEGIGPIHVFDPEPNAVQPFYGMAQLPCEMTFLDQRKSGRKRARKAA